MKQTMKKVEKKKKKVKKETKKKRGKKKEKKEKKKKPYNETLLVGKWMNKVLKEKREIKVVLLYLCCYYY
jgi:hypothetical protein